MIWNASGGMGVISEKKNYFRWQADFWQNTRTGMMKDQIPVRVFLCKFILAV